MTALETLEEAKQWLREHVEEGVRCPCCNQMAKVYRRPLPATAARGVITLFREAGFGFAHLPTLVKRYMRDVSHQGGYASLGGYWGLIEEERGVKRDDGGRAGWWRVTYKGEQWVRGLITVPKYSHIYDGKVLRQSGPETTVRQALGTKFDYNELMGHEGRASR